MGVKMVVHPDPFAAKVDNAATATAASKMITMAGSVDVAAYVYCAVAKTASRRMLNATANATAPAKPVVKEAVNLQSPATAAKYHIQRAETKAGALTFSIAIDGLL